MKKLLLIVGIVCVAVCVLCLIFAVMSLSAYYNVMDGSAELYNRLHQRAIINFVIGIVFAVIGAACLILRTKM